MCVKERKSKRDCLLSRMCLCVCVRGMRQAPLDLLLLVYKRVQSAKLLLLYKGQASSVRTESVERRKSIGSAIISKICWVKVMEEQRFIRFKKNRKRKRASERERDIAHD